MTLVDMIPPGPRSHAALGSRSPAPKTPTATRTSSSTPPPRPAGLQTSLALLAPETSVLDLSWYGDREVRLSLGARFHSTGLPSGPARSEPFAGAGRPTDVR